MIDDSHPWKIELLKIADRLERRKSQLRWTEQTSLLAERDIMIAAYAIRKLMEARKLSDQLSTYQIAVHRFAASGQVPNHFNVHRFWNNYDLDSAERSTLSLRQLCNQIIHSFNWVLVMNESGHSLAGVLVSSRERRQYLYSVDIDDLIESFRCVGHDDVVEIRWRIDETGAEQVELLGADTRSAQYEWLMTGHRPDDWLRGSENTPG